MTTPEAWKQVKADLHDSGVPCSNIGCPACTPLKDGIETIESFLSEMYPLDFEGEVT